jgi:hypothetical protein
MALPATAWPIPNTDIGDPTLAHIKLPDPLARRHLLEGGLDPQKARSYAEAYLAAGREVEAVDFLAMAESRDELESLQQRAIERGDVFLMRIVSAALGAEPSSATWTALATAAAAAGRERDAESAQRLATVGS